MGKDLKGKEIGENICQRKDGRYTARYVDRFGKRKSVYGATVKEVRNKLSKAITEDAQHKNVVNEKITLDEWYEKWMRVYKIPVIRENSKRHYEHVYTTKISPELGKYRIIDITKIHVTSLLNQLKEQGYGWETLSKVRILLTDMFNRAMEDEFVVRNPAKGARIPLNRPPVQTKALSKTDQKDFFECAAGTFYYNLFLVAINTGLRPGELFALTEQDIDFDKKEISVTKTLVYQKFDGDAGKEFHLGPPKTDSSVRKVPMNKICENALIMQIKLHKILYSRSPYQKKLEFPDLLFTTKFCTPMNSVIYSAAIDSIIKEINLMRDSLDQMDSFSGHTFRHTFATRCFEAGIEAKTVQTYLGHATLQMTMDLYTSVMPQKKMSGVEKLADSIDIDAPDVPTYADEKIVSFPNQNVV
jgi:integrase